MPSSPADRAGAMTPDDLDDVVAIERVSFPTPWTRAHFVAELRSPVARLPVERDGSGRVVAYACAWEVAGELQINDVAVHPAWRRRGIARRIVQGLIAGARARGCTSSSLEVRPSNAAARELYARLGFHETGRRRGYYADTGEDAILMHLSLRTESSLRKGACP